MSTKNLAVTNLPISTLNSASRNPRTHSQAQLRQIADSIKTFGFTNPILIDGNQTIVAGHGRIEAAKLLGLECVPTICLDGLTRAQLRAYAIADNKLAENAGWDNEILTLEFQYIAELDIEFDLTLTGFETPEIDIFLAGGETGDEDPADEVPPIIEDQPALSCPGDLWLLGRHRVLCGDATHEGAYKQLMVGEQAQLVFVDPPYNVRIQGNVCGLGSIQHKEFEMASGEMTPDEFTSFLSAAFTLLAGHSCEGAIQFVCMDWRHIGELMAAGQGVYTELKNLCIWNKNNGGMGSLYRSKHELVFVFKHGSAPHINNVELGRHGRNRTNVWDYAGVNTLREGRMEELAMHPTVKPVALVRDAIFDCSNRGDVVLDSFGGSGSTLIAAEQADRRARLMELDPRYVDVIVRRFQKETGQEVIHSQTELTFSQLAEQRHQIPLSKQVVEGEKTNVQ